MPLFPTLVGGMEFRERKPRYAGEPIYKRLDFVRPKTQSDDYEIVKTIYKEPRAGSEQADGQVVEVGPQGESMEGPPRLTYQQWHHVEQTRQLQHQQRIQEQQEREHRARQQAAFEQWQRMEAMRHAQWQQQQEQAQRMGGHPGGHHHGGGGGQQIPPPPPPPHGHGHGHGRAPGQPMQIDNQHPPQIVDITGQIDSDSSDDEIVSFVEIRPGGGRRRGASRRPAMRVFQQDEIYSSSDEDEQPTRSRSRRRTSASRHGYRH